MTISDPACISGSRIRRKNKNSVKCSIYEDGTSLVPFSKTGLLPVLCPSKPVLDDLPCGHQTGHTASVNGRGTGGQKNEKK